MKANEIMNNELHITTNHTGKMKGMCSISTSCKTNANCERYSKIPGSVCQKCYAQRMMQMYKQMSPCYERNAEILTSRVLKMDELPVINSKYFRFEAFGDLHNEIQLENYFNICKKNKATKFALWTKNPHIVAKIADKKPKNLQILVSSLFLNKEVDISNMPYIDKVFTVYDKKTISENNIEINCGGRSCASCLRCYKNNGEKHIREKLK